MSSRERLASHYRMESWIKLKYPWLEDGYPELLCFIEDLLSHLEEYTKREQELFDVENHILWVDYRDYRFKIYLDAERHVLVGDVLLDNEIDIVGVESDSLDCLVEKLERHTDEQISYRFQSQLAKEIIQHQDRIRELDKSSTILQQYYLQLERLALKDKKDEFSPFELRQQLIEISILFSGILDKRLEQVKKDYCERVMKIEDRNK